MIRFNEPPFLGTEVEYIADAIRQKHIAGGGKYFQLCCGFLEQSFGADFVRLTTSGTDALEAAAILCDIKPGDEVIMPSFTFVSTANAFVLRGARIVFVDVRPDTMNLDETKIEAAITEKTKVIVPVHYAGVSCEMDEICAVAKRHGLFVVEDAAQGIFAEYKGKSLGTIGDIGCYSFHETKNISMGEGGALLVNNPALRDRADVICNKGTNRADFARGLVDKYSWTDVGSSYLPGDLNAAYLYAQLLDHEKIEKKRKDIWNRYHNAMIPLAEEGLLETMCVPDHCEHNAHTYYIKLASAGQREELMKYLSQRQIVSAFHFVPLHSAPAGGVYGRFCGEDVYTTKESDRLLRLPLHYNLTDTDADAVIGAVRAFFGR
ncbi:MAG: dTDP-4-amino-4,6-dideoxygalactose transaminase [Clostridia bacterium]|nr:dTDP-4-amino-4,6-dideoxygalactose transaminase [Clostridia bacterium]